MHPNDPFNYNPTRTPLDKPESNGLGIAGFVVSMVGLLSCGCLSIVGVGLSAFALRRRPRGFAIAGLIIGLVGVLFMLLFVILIVTFGGLIIVPAMLDGYKVNEAIKTYQQSNNGALPQTWADVPGMSGGLVDNWGHAYVYQVGANGRCVELLSNGPDGISGTPDDVTVVIEDDVVSADMGPTTPRQLPKSPS